MKSTLTFLLLILGAVVSLGISSFSDSTVPVEASIEMLESGQALFAAGVWIIAGAIACFVFFRSIYSS